MQENPFFTTWDTPFQAPPFEKIKTEHYIPAFEEAIKLQMAEIDSIAFSNEAPTFKNTILALEYTGALLTKVSSVFYPMISANTNKDIQKIQTEMASILSSHNDDIYLNLHLFDRVKTVYMSRDELGFSAEQERLRSLLYMLSP